MRPHPSTGNSWTGPLSRSHDTPPLTRPSIGASAGLTERVLVCVRCADFPHHHNPKREVDIGWVPSSLIIASNNNNNSCHYLKQSLLPPHKTCFVPFLLCPGGPGLAWFLGSFLPLPSSDRWLVAKIGHTECFT